MKGREVKRKEMKKFLALLLILCSSAAFLGCAGRLAKPPEEKLLWSFPERKPAWLTSPPEKRGKNFFFVGFSDRCATERDAREDALEDAMKNAVSYIGMLVEERIEKKLPSYGREILSQIADPTELVMGFEKELSIIMKPKAEELYIEKWQDRFGSVYWKAYALLRISSSTIDRACMEAVKLCWKAMREAYSKAKEEAARRRFKDAMKAFDEMKERGFGEK